MPTGSDAREAPADVVPAQYRPDPIRSAGTLRAATPLGGPPSRSARQRSTPDRASRIVAALHGTRLATDRRPGRGAGRDGWLDLDAGLDIDLDEADLDEAMPLDGADPVRRVLAALHGTAMTGTAP